MFAKPVGKRIQETVYFFHPTDWDKTGRLLDGSERNRNLAGFKPSRAAKIIPHASEPFAVYNFKIHIDGVVARFHCSPTFVISNRHPDSLSLTWLVFK